MKLLGENLGRMCDSIRTTKYIFTLASKHNLYKMMTKKIFKKCIIDVGDTKIKFIFSETNGCHRDQEKKTEFVPIICSSTSFVRPFVSEVEKIALFY